MLKQSHLDAMSPKWRELMDRHPAMFKHLWRPPECAEGWYDLLDKLMTDLETVLSTMNQNVNSNVNQTDENVNKATKNVTLKVRQIKEKFGLLRFYIETNCSFNEELLLQTLIVSAEEKSGSICEICGEEGRLRRNNGWLRTLCALHCGEWGGKST